jgi:glucokinase
MTDSAKSQRAQVVIGIDVGGTKCAGGLVLFPEGRVLSRRLQPTRPERGGEAVLLDVIDVARSLQREASELNGTPAAIGLGVAELVGVDGRVLSGATIQWQGLAVDEAIRSATGLWVRVEADVRAAARGEANLGAGSGFHSYLFATVGTGISSSLVIDRRPYLGARGLTGTFASSRGLIPGDDGGLAAGPPLEQFASGPAIAARYATACPGFAGTALDVVARANGGDSMAREIVVTAGHALGAAIGHLVNVIDPEAVVIGGGLGLVEGHYREAVETAMRRHIWSDLHRDLPLRSAELGNDAGFVGAALSAFDCP